MPGYGRFSHGPRRWGRASRSGTQVILDGLLADYGTALSKDPSSYNYVEALAFARCINNAWSTLRRLRNQFDPERMTDYLPRWERIFGISPSPSASKKERRAEVARRFRFLGLRPDSGALLQFLQEVLPDCSPTVVHTSSADALTHAAYLDPGTGLWTGVNVAGGIRTPGESGVYWSSSIAYVLVLATRPSTMTVPEFDSLFYGQLGRVHRYLNDWLPAWVTYAYAVDAHGFPTSADEGFYLDEPDLDIERLTIYIDGPSIGGGAFTQEVFPYVVSRVPFIDAYANYYRFEVTGGPVLVTVDVSRVSGTGLYASIIGGPSRDGAILATGGTFVLSSIHFTATLPDGVYVLEVNSNGVDTIDGDTSPFTATITLS